MTRIEIRRRALHAAAAVSFTVGLLACGEAVLVVDGAGTSSAGSGSSSGGGGDSGADPNATPDAGATSDAALADATDPNATDAGLEPDAVADASSPCGNAGDPGYVDCCAQLNWDIDAGCLAWGPPMPPSMEIA